MNSCCQIRYLIWAHDERVCFPGDISQSLVWLFCKRTICHRVQEALEELDDKGCFLSAVQEKRNGCGVRVVPCIVAGLPLSLLWQSVTEDLFTNSTFLFLPILILAWFITLNLLWVWKGDPPWCGRNRSFTNFVQKIGLKSAILSPTNKNEIILRSALWPQFLKVSLLLTCSLKNLGENF